MKKKRKERIEMEEPDLTLGQGKVRFENQERKLYNKIMMKRRKIMSSYIENSQGRCREKERLRIDFHFFNRGVI